MQDLSRRARFYLHRRRDPFWGVSFPKSGRTWTKTLVERYYAERYDLPAFTFEEFAPWVRTGAWRRVPRLVFIHPHCEEPDPALTERFMTTLAPRRVLFIHRDPRDVVLTYYFRLRKRMGHAEALQLDFPTFLRHPALGLPRIVDFSNAWAAADGRFRDYLRVRFEDVRDEPAPQLERLLRFLGEEPDPAIVARVVAATADSTTRAVEDPGLGPAAADLEYMRGEMARLDPVLGYQVP